VDGERVTELGRRVDPETSVIRVDDMRVTTSVDRLYLALNKPLGMLTSMSDDKGRPHVGELVADRNARHFHVGRLDADTEGLLLLTNDGDLAHRLTHPSYGVEKTYLAEVQGPVARDVGKRLREGVLLDDGPVAVDRFRVVDSAAGKVLVEVVLHEGRKHVVRRLHAPRGQPGHTLVPVCVGPGQLGGPRPGKIRPLTSQEVAALYAAVDM
jgi:23S rRNA pseudouridine2605 synthase